MSLRRLNNRGARVLTSGLVNFKLVKSKRSAEKYYLVIAILLGLAILVISLYWIFQEYIQGDINTETCRQSIILRQSMPQSEKRGTTSVEDIMNNFPLKCETQVVNIDTDNVNAVHEIVYQTIADNLLGCWDLFGGTENGAKYHIFPVNFAKERYDFAICNRIVLSAKTLDALKKSGTGTRLDIYYWLNYHTIDGREIKPEDFQKELKNTYIYYLTMPGCNNPFNPSGGCFKFPDNNEWNSQKNFAINNKSYGVRKSIDASNGEIMIGVQFYSNREHWESLGYVQYEWAYPFYVQWDVDSNKFSGDGKTIQSIPA